MDPLQSFAPPPRRPPISPKTKARDGVSRKVFALPVIHQFQPVLASSPRSYMAAGAGQKAAAEKAAHHSGQVEGGANGQDPELIGPAVNAGITSPSMVPRHPNRPKSREAMESPRVLHPQQPPAGISSRTDVDIYRYSQGTEQRMAIRPLFEQRRESGTGKHQPVSPKCSQQEAEREAGDTVENDDGVRREEDDRRSRGMWQRDERDADESKTGGEEIPQLDDSLARGLLRVYDTPNQEDRRPELPLDVDASMRDNNDVHAVEEQDQYGSIIGYDRVGMAETAEKGTNLASPAEDTLMKPLDISCCHEPFLQTEGPKLDRLRNTVKVVSSEPTESSALLDNDQVPSGGVHKSGELVYKVMRKDQRTLGDRLVLVTVLLSSRGDVRITFKTVNQAADVSADGEEEAVVVIADAELAQSKHLRPDLHVLTPEWAEWIITRVRCDVGDVFYLGLDDAQGSEKRRCFSEIVTVNGKELAVEMFVLTATNSLLVSSREIESNLSSGEILLRPDEVRRLAASFGKLDKEQDVLALVEDYEFLVRIANDSNILRLGSDCAGFVGELDDFALGGRCGRLATSPSIAENEDAVASEPQLDDLGLLHPANGVQTILEGNKLVAAIAFLAQAYGENATLSALRQFQQKEAIQLYVTSVMQQAVRTDKESAFNDRVQQKMEAAQKAKLQEIAVMSIVNDMVTDLISLECCVELHDAKYYGEYDDHYASKIQAAYRMSTQKKLYAHKRQVHECAAQVLQALYRGVGARRRYSEMKVEREKNLFDGLRANLDHATANTKDPRSRARELSKEVERRRHIFLMQVLQGYVAENYVLDGFRVSAQLVREIYDEYGVVVGCSTNFGDVVASYLANDFDPAVCACVGDNPHASTPPRQFSNREVSTALLLGLEDQCDDTFGLSSKARRLTTGSQTRSKQMTLEADESTPPRRMLKTCLAFQQSNRNRLAALRLTRKAAGQKSAHLVARNFRDVLSASFDSFDSCRAAWETEIRVRHDQQRLLDMFSVDELVHHCLELLISSVKDWGIDPDPLFEALNLCIRHCHGKAAIRLVEEKFNAHAAGVNELHGKWSVLPLRREISQELEDFEKLLALRCINIALDDAFTIPASELLHLMLKGNLDDEYIRHGLPSVLPIASITEKYDLARKMLVGFANASYGDAFNLICWSCLDAAENVTVEAAQLLDKLTRLEIGSESEARPIPRETQPTTRFSQALAARALYLLTGCQAVRFLQFMAKVAHFSKVIQKRVLAHLAPYAEKYEMHRLASVICALDDFALVSRIFDDCFSIEALHDCESVWAQYKALFGEERTVHAMPSRSTQMEADAGDGQDVAG